jgi:uncharacterized membrane protein
MNLILQILSVIFIVYFLYDILKHKFSFYEMLSDNRGNISSMRFMSFMCFWLFVWMVIHGVLTNTFNFDIVLIVGCLAFFPKLFQKYVEAYLERGQKKE